MSSVHASSSANSLTQLGHEPHDQRESDAEQQARDDRKIKGAAAALDGDVARKAAESQGQTPAEEQHSSEASDNQADQNEPLAELAKRVHGLVLVTATPHPPDFCNNMIPRDFSDKVGQQYDSTIVSADVRFSAKRCARN